MELSSADSCDIKEYHLHFHVTTVHWPMARARCGSASNHVETPVWHRTVLVRRKILVASVDGILVVGVASFAGSNRYVASLVTIGMPQQ
jgi:hypothetical protein